MSAAGVSRRAGCASRIHAGTPIGSSKSAVRVQGQTRREAGTQSYGGRQPPTWPSRHPALDPTFPGGLLKVSRRLTVITRARDQRGFTLLEVLCVMLVLGVL